MSRRDRTVAVMDLRPAAVRALLEHLERLPGVGPRTARGLAEHLLTTEPAAVGAFASALDELHDRVRLCSSCSTLTEDDPCPVCTDPERDRGTILVVEAPTTIWAVEDTRQYNGLYHALLGHLSPLHGVGPDDLTIDRLVERCRADEVTEVILATDPTVEGETTAVYIARRPRSPGRGQPAGIGDPCRW